MLNMWVYHLHNDLGIEIDVIRYFIPYREVYELPEQDWASYSTTVDCC